MIVAALAFQKNQAQSPAPTANLSDKEVISLLSYSDTPDASETARHNQLLALGQKAYPALCRELLKTNDGRYAANIVNFLTKMEGDKTLRRDTFLKTMKKWSSRTGEDDGESTVIRSSIVEALGKVGTNEDKALLLALLSDPAEYVRTASIKSLGQLGDERDLQQLEVWLKAQNVPASAPQKTYDIVAAEKVIPQMRERLNQLKESHTGTTDANHASQRANASTPVATVEKRSLPNFPFATLIVLIGVLAGAAVFLIRRKSL